MGDNYRVPKGHNDIIQPFEWLTSPLSLKHLILSHALSSQEEEEEPCSSSSKTTKKAMHVGSGSSTVGEFLVEVMNYDLVVDVDKDEETLGKMQQRWQKKCRTTRVDPDRLQYCTVDFSTSPIPFADNYFDLILDKSTLDCTLCSYNASASLLIQVYRTLAVGGVYILISFHELEMLLPLLSNLPGASWDITCATMQRQVEGILDPTTTTDTHTVKPLNVLIARKTTTTTESSTSLESSPLLDFDQVCRHLNQVNDDWFQTHQPLLTQARTQELEKAFEKEEALPLPKAYQVLFTDAERENLLYEHFLEDWHAFVEEQPLLSEEADMVSCSVALAFLKEMQ